MQGPAARLKCVLPLPYPGGWRCAAIIGYPCPDYWYHPRQPRGGVATPGQPRVQTEPAWSYAPRASRPRSALLRCSATGKVAIEGCNLSSIRGYLGEPTLHNQAGALGALSPLASDRIRELTLRGIESKIDMTPNVADTTKNRTARSKICPLLRAVQPVLPIVTRKPTVRKIACAFEHPASSHRLLLLLLSLQLVPRAYFASFRRSLASRTMSAVAS